MNALTDPRPIEEILNDFSHLKPADQWEYDRFKVDYYASEHSETVLHTRYLIAMDDEAERVISSYTSFPRGCEWARWECVEQNVKVPRERGQYGHLIHATRWEDNTYINWDYAC